ncbi:MAG: hypothetical protein ACM3JB_20710 [Acidobacteriaceae bacterium]
MMGERMGWLLLALGMLIVAVVLGLPESLFGQGQKGPEVRMVASNATPREVEDQTKDSVVRDYGKAWQSLEQALEDNRPDLLDANFVGYAQERWLQTIKAQKAAGLSRRIMDHGNQLQVLFYSADGSAIQLRDTAQLEIQYRDGSKVVQKQSLSAHYLVLMTPAENSWKVRVLQEIAPGSAQQASLRVSEAGAGLK